MICSLADSHYVSEEPSASMFVEKGYIVGSFETLGSIYQTTRRHIPEVHVIHSHQLGIPKYEKQSKLLMIY
jgi:hypothetical protein